MGVRHRMGAPLHAQSQGQVERQNQLIANLRCVCYNDVRVWPSRIFQLQFSHNTSVSAATGFTPFELLFARSARRPESAVSESRARDEQAPLRSTDGRDAEVAERRRKLDEIHQKAQVSVHNSQTVRVQRGAVKARGQPFEVGDLVRLRLTPAERSRRGGKLAPVLSSLYKVIEVLRGGWTYRVSRLSGVGRKSDVKIRHYNDLVSSAAHIDADAVSRRNTEKAPYSEEDSESALSDVSSDSDVSDTSSDSGGHDHAASGHRPRRSCGPPSRLIVNPRRKRYEETSGGV